MKKKNKNISKLLFKNTLIVVSTILSIFLFVFLFSFLTFRSGQFPPGRPHPLQQFLFSLFIIITISIVITFRSNYNIAKSIQQLEKATEEVAKGNFDIQLNLTKNESINSYIKNFNKMVRELNQMEILQADFIANVSHEFKTPLNVIQSYSKALIKDNLDAETKKQYAEVLENNIKKLTNLTTNILNLSKLENQEIEIEKKEFLLDEQIRQCIVSMRPEWSKKNIDLDLSLPKTKIIGCEDLISQIWQNLINNAIKFSNDNGKIKIKITTDNEKIFITIIDNGIGMSKETINKIFDKFYQGDTSHSKDGNGLGLALVYRILKICDGTISVKSEENKGSTFVVSLPNQSI